MFLGKYAEVDTKIQMYIFNPKFMFIPISVHSYSCGDYNYNVISFFGFRIAMFAKE